MKEYTFTYNAQITHIQRQSDNAKLAPMSEEERAKGIAKLIKKHFGVDDVIVTDVKCFERELEV